MHIRLSREVVERLKKEAAIERLRSASGLAALLIEKGLSNGAGSSPGLCTRDAGHDGPCNGIPLHGA